MNTVPSDKLSAMRAALAELAAAARRGDASSTREASARLAALAQGADLPMLVNAARAAAHEPSETRLATLGWEIDRATHLRPSTRMLPPTLTSGKVLILDPSDASRATMVDLVRAQLVAASEASTVAEGLAVAALGSVQAVIADVSLTHDLHRFAPLPVAVVADEGPMAQRAAAVYGGACLYLERPLSAEAVGMVLQRLLESRQPPPARLLAIDDDEGYLERLRLQLGGEGFQVRTLADPLKLVDLLESQRPDLVLLDTSMPAMSGYDLCRIVRANPAWQDLPIVFLTSRHDAASEVEAFRAGADDFVRKDDDPRELFARIRTRIARANDLRLRSERDALTGLFRRSAFMASLSQLLNQGKRRARPLALAVLDLDRFKDINDRHGHLDGDRVLMGLGKLINSRFRAEDVRGRWGGEELVIAFPDETGAGVVPAVQRLLDDLRAIPFGESPFFHATFSAGVANFPEDGGTPAELFGVADRRLYVAKRLGRARVVAVD